MREIRFRAWDKKNKKWLWPYPDGFHIIGEVTVFECLKQQCKTDEYKNLEIVEYTGLKDRNGNDIYEGDIIKYFASDWLDKTPKTTDMTFRSWGSWWPDGTFTIEIIGNIYENHKLLEIK